MKIEVFVKIIVFDFMFEILICGGDDLYIGGDWFVVVNLFKWVIF